MLGVVVWVSLGDGPFLEQRFLLFLPLGLLAGSVLLTVVMGGLMWGMICIVDPQAARESPFREQPGGV